MRAHNFSAGPAVLPEVVVDDATRAIRELDGARVGLLECSHRAAAFDEVLEQTKTRLHRLLGLDDTQEILFLHGGARTQFFMIPMNSESIVRNRLYSVGKSCWMSAEPKKIPSR